MKSSVRQQTLELMKAGLWGQTPDPSLFSSCDWESLIQLAKEQTILGLVMDGKSRLPQECQPERKQNLKWLGLISKIQQKNEQMDKAVAGVQNSFRNKGWHPLIIKGQVIAREYPTPGLRHSGDIDIWFPIPQEAEQAIQWAQQHFKCKWMPGEKETAFTVKGIIIELHRRIAEMAYTPYNEAMQRIFSDNVRLRSLTTTPDTTANLTTTTLINDTEIETLPILINAFYQIIHLEYHILNEGVGLRQFCDLAVFTSNHSAELKAQSTLLNQWLLDCGLQRIAAVIGRLLVSQLGVEATAIPWDLTPAGIPQTEILAAADTIMSDVWTGGNFGKKKWQFKDTAGFFEQKVKALPLHWAQYRKFRHLLPNEAWANFLSKFLRASKGVK